MQNNASGFFVMIGLACALSQCTGPTETGSYEFKDSATGDVIGFLTLKTTGDGSTNFQIKLSELPPATELTANLHGGSCKQPSASFSRLAGLQVGTDGNAATEGPVRFRDTEDVAFATLTDGEHVVVVQGEGVRGCARILARY